MYLCGANQALYLSIYTVFEKNLDTKMNKIYIFYISFIISILLSTLALSQTTVFSDNFDNYTAGQRIACQSNGVWKTWSNLPCDSNEDAFVSSNNSFSGVNSIVIQNSNDIVRELGTPISNGISEINFQVFIPTNKSGYFNTLTNFDPPTYQWAMQVFFKTNGTGTIDAGGSSAATFSYPQNQWFLLKIIADLSADSGKLFLDGNLIHRWKWSAGSFGNGNDKRLDGNDFYGNLVTDEMYIDDYSIVILPPATSKSLSTNIGGNWNDASTWVNRSVPQRTSLVEIVAGATVTLNGNVSNRNASTIVNGTLVLNNYYLSGSGDFHIGSGGTIQIGSADGISSSGSTGNIRMTGIRNFSPYANYVYNGTNAQMTGNGLPRIVKNLIINNNAWVTLSSSISVGNLNLINGNLSTESNSISVGTSITNVGVLNNTNGKILGDLNRWVSNSNSVLFPVGSTPSKYTPVILSNIVGAGLFTVTAVNGIHPNALDNDFLQMYWKLVNGGITSADIEFHYLDSDVVGNEESYLLYRYDGDMHSYSPFSLNSTNNIASASGVNSFSDWTLGIEEPLPVELTLLSATVIGTTVKLSWQTATEINNYGFEVERKLNNMDQISDNWEKIGFVNGNGNSNSTKSYSFIDKNTSTGKYSYRLKQIDNDGQFEYSKSIEVNIKRIEKFELSQNYPNPFNPATTISFSLPEASNVKLTLYNLLGQEIETLIDGFKESGTHSFSFNASQLNSGVYIYKLETNGFTQTRKMTLIK